MKKYFIVFILLLFVSVSFVRLPHATAADQGHEIIGTIPNSKLTFNVPFKVGDSLSITFRVKLSSWPPIINGVKLSSSTIKEQTQTLQVTQKMFDNNPDQLVITAGGDSSVSVTILNFSLNGEQLFPEPSKDFSGGLLDNKTVKNGSISTVKFTDNDKDSFETVSDTWVYDFDKPVDITAFRYLSDATTNIIVTFLNADGVEKTKSITVPEMDGRLYMLDMKYVVSIKGNKPTSSYKLFEMNFYGELSPLLIPDDVSNVTYEATDKDVLISYNLPKNLYFDHLEIYKGNTLIMSSVKTDSVKISDLIPSFDYSFKIVSVSKDGGRSSGYNLSFKTDDKPDAEPPSQPKGLKVKAGNQALFVSWQPNPENDVIGYNIFLNGKKLNGSLVKNTSYVISDLENDKSYDVSVQAVNSSAKKSVLTDVSGTPYEKGMPSFKNGYKLKDVGVGVNSWFSSLWLILAFAIGIPLAFYIAHRVKALFFT